MKTAFFIVLLCAAGRPAFAQEPPSAAAGDPALPLPPLPKKETPVQEKRLILCEELSDNFCQTLHSSDKRGDFQFADGTWILHGERRENFISQAKFIHLQKEAESRCRMPDDLKFALGIKCGPGDDKRDLLSRLGDQLAKLDSIPSSERERRAWKRSLEQISRDFQYIVYDAVYERSFNEKPDLRDKFWRDYSAAEKKLFNRHYYDIQTEITDAVYLNDPNWLKIVDLFEEVRADVLTVVSQTAFTSETKKAMQDKIRSVKISLPYEDPRTTNASAYCAEYANNGYYSRTDNHFVLCAGKINTSQNEGAFYGVIAHEIAHSIDPNTFLADVFKQTPLAELLSRLYESGANLPCEYWEEQKREIFSSPSEIHRLPPGLRHIDQCLADRSGLDELNPSSLDYASKRTAENNMNSYASDNEFSYLTTPFVFEDNELTENEFYLKPKLLAEKNNQYFEQRNFSQGMFHPASVFIQEYKCRLARSGFAAAESGPPDLLNKEAALDLARDSTANDDFEERRKGNQALWEHLMSSDDKLIAAKQSSLRTKEENDRLLKLQQDFFDMKEEFLVSKSAAAGEAFADALKETKRLNEIYEYSRSAVMAENSRELIDFNLSKPSDEDFADWIANEAISLKLQRTASLQDRRDFIFAEHAFYCEPESLGILAKDKILIEKTYSRSFHSPDRERRLRNFTPKTAELLQCVRGEDIKKLEDPTCDFFLQ